MAHLTHSAIANAIVLISWVSFLLSFFLPATNILESSGSAPGTPLTGWEAFESSIWCGALNPWAWLGDTRVLVFLFYPLTNSVMLLAPWFRTLGPYAALLPLILVPSAGILWALPHELLGDLYIGFYVWNASYLMASIGCFWQAISDENIAF